MRKKPAKSPQMDKFLRNLSTFQEKGTGDAARQTQARREANALSTRRGGRDAADAQDATSTAGGSMRKTPRVRRGVDAQDAASTAGASATQKRMAKPSDLGYDR